MSRTNKNYFLSLHYEAKARMHYLRFKKAEKELNNSKSKYDFLKTFCKMAREKWQSLQNKYTECTVSRIERFQIQKIEDKKGNRILV